VKREDWNEKEKDCIARIEKVLTIVSTDGRDQLLFRQWLSFSFQNAGTKKCTWSIFMQGAQGSGKTFWHELMSAILGRQNTRTISAQEMAGQFTGWGQGSCFATVEEVKLHGNLKWDIMNKFKPYITNAMVPIERKGRDALDVINTVTYLILSQFKDGYPLEDSDRRIYPLFSSLQTKEDVDKFTADVELNWWGITHDSLHECSGAVAGWLLETDMKGFTPNKAPKGRAKDQMIELARSEEQVFVRELLESKEHPHITSKLIATRDITNAAHEANEILNLQTTRLKRLLSSLGFDQISTRVTVGENKLSFWTKDAAVLPLKSKALRELYLEQTKLPLPVDFVD